jgi:hypothetical protein
MHGRVTPTLGIAMLSLAYQTEKNIWTRINADLRGFLPNCLARLLYPR